MTVDLIGVIMPSWRRCLDAPGVHDRAARADYSAIARYLCRREFAGWGPLWVLAPPESRPHLAAAVVVARYTDDLCDRGPVEGRTQRFKEWAAHVGTALDTGSSGHRLLRPYLHSAALLNLARMWIDTYLAGIPIDLDFPGFAQEADYQRYVDAVSLPSVMILAEAMPGLAPGQNFIAYARLNADGGRRAAGSGQRAAGSGQRAAGSGQRTDLLTDMFEDLRDGRLRLPVSDLDRYGVSQADLEQGRDTPAVRALISATVSSARASLAASEQILGEIAPEYRPLFDLCRADRAGRCPRQVIAPPSRTLKSLQRQPVSAHEPATPTPCNASRSSTPSPLTNNGAGCAVGAPSRPRAIQFDTHFRRNRGVRPRSLRGEGCRR
ncbi:squalene/phytoene synthase family protein [Nocardia sp. KC 131]|uniref:squalene/phytoene synthase family protein n=1 Tax=Nocardia arseniciresistens TaxID=3392119 RepID=UPI00398EBFDD